MTSVARLECVVPDGCVAPDAARPAAADERIRRELVATVEAATVRWCARQRETLGSLSALLHALQVSRDPVRTAEAWMDWQARALGRLAEDARDQRDISLALARCCGDGRLLEPAGPSEPAGLEAGDAAGDVQEQKRLDER